MRIPGLVLGALLAAATASPANSQTAAPAQPPTLVVLVTIDGLPARHLQKFGPQLTGGIGRMMKGGAWFTNGHQDHGITETAPGHASLLSGRFPRSTGIAANRIGVSDPASALLGGTGAAGASPHRFQGTALFDWMKAKNGRSRALSVSAKDRGAILPIGKAKAEVYWYPGDGSFTTSRYYMDTLPRWVSAFNSRRLPQSYAGRSWTLLLPESEYKERDDVEAEGHGSNFVFPHVVTGDSVRAANLIRATPFIDEVTVAFALEGVNAMGLGKGPAPDLLAISLSGTDAVHHRLGPDSREAHDQLLRTDRLVGQLLDSLYRMRDSSRVVVAFTADHGFGTIPELAAAGENPRATRTTLDDALASGRAKMSSLGVDSLALDVDQQIVLMDRRAFERPRANPDTVLNAFIASARQTPGIKRIDRFAALLSADTLTDPIARRWNHQFSKGTNVELVATLEPGSLWTTLLVASHGSPYDYDSHVPIIFYGAAFKPGQHAGFVRTVDIGPTLARVLNVRPTERLDGVPLANALK